MADNPNPTSWFDSPLQNQLVSIPENFDTLGVAELAVNGFANAGNANLALVFINALEAALKMVHVQPIAPIQRCKLAVLILQKLAASTLNPHTMDWTINPTLANVLIYLLNWYLKYQSAHYPCMNPWFGEHPIWSYTPEEFCSMVHLATGFSPFEGSTNGLFQRVWGLCDTFIPEVEQFLKAAADLIRAHNQNKLPPHRISNIIFWTWGHETLLVLEDVWPYFRHIDEIHRTELNRHMEIPLKLDTSLVLKHATSVSNFIRILQDSQGGTLSIQPKETPGQYFYPGLSWYGINLPGNLLDHIEQTQGHTLATNNYYGSVVLTFPFPWQDYSEGYVLGTRKFWKEFSQVIMIPPKNAPDLPHYHVEARGIKRLERVSLMDYNWILRYVNNTLINVQEWTHPEFAFADTVRIPLSDVRITFTSHSCSSDRIHRCKDCESRIDTAPQAITEFVRIVRQTPGLEQFVRENLTQAFTQYLVPASLTTSP